MMRLAWLTDIHLNFLEDPARQAFLQALAAQPADALAITGDIAESPAVDRFLIEMAQAFGRPIYFVLGNHDFYRGSISETREAVACLSQRSPLLTYLSVSPAIALTESTALIGHDGWADARQGDFEHSSVILNDYLLIEELRKWQPGFVLDREALRRELHARGDEAAAHLAGQLNQALQTHRQVVAVIHVPPFRQTCLHRGQVADDNWLPHFTCQAAGDALTEIMNRHPDRELTVLCGHTHSGCDVQVLPNLRVLSGAAEYGEPCVQRILDLP